MLYVSLTSPTQFISHPSHFIGSFKYYQQLNTSSISDRRSSVLYFNEPASGCVNFVDKEENEAEVSVEDRSRTRQLNSASRSVRAISPSCDFALFSVLYDDVLARCHAITEYIPLDPPWGTVEKIPSSMFRALCLVGALSPPGIILRVLAL